jgi:hypothetical protein
MNYYKVKDIEKPLFDLMLDQCKGIKWIEQAFFNAWDSYTKDEWNYDGATFVQEQDNNYWEVAAFIHDYLNNIGYVGKKVDLYFIKIMIDLNYSENIIFERCKWMQFTFINYAWHYLRGKNPQNKLPK